MTQVFLILFRESTNLIRKHTKGVVFNTLPLVAGKLVVGADAQCPWDLCEIIRLSM